MFRLPKPLTMEEFRFGAMLAKEGDKGSVAGRRESSSLKFFSKTTWDRG